MAESSQQVVILAAVQPIATRHHRIDFGAHSPSRRRMTRRPDPSTDHHIPSGCRTAAAPHGPGSALASLKAGTGSPRSKYRLRCVAAFCRTSQSNGNELNSAHSARRRRSGVPKATSPPSRYGRKPYPAARCRRSSCARHWIGRCHGTQGDSAERQPHVDRAGCDAVARLGVPESVYWWNVFPSCSIRSAVPAGWKQPASAVICRSLPKRICRSAHHVPSRPGCANSVSAIRRSALSAQFQRACRRSRPETALCRS